MRGTCVRNACVCVTAYVASSLPPLPLIAIPQHSSQNPVTFVDVQITGRRNGRGRGCVRVRFTRRVSHRKSQVPTQNNKKQKPTTKNKTKIKGGSGLLRSRRHRRRRRSRCSCASPFTGPVRVSLRCRRVCGCCEGRVSGFVFFAFKSLARVSVGALFGGRSLSCSAVCFAWSLLILRQPLSMWGANRE